ncbi:MAG: GtrA family protein [Thiobacillus sp.]|nr:GtrA family protein [Thiobacillus sp.]
MPFITGGTKGVPGKMTLRTKVWTEMAIAARFGLIGIAATIVHILVVSLLLAATQMQPLFSNAIAFLTAFSVSFTGNYWWTFGAPGNPAKAMRRFILISGSAFVLNTIVLAVILRAAWFSPFISVMCAIAIVPALTFLASRLWGFRT